VRGNGSKKMVWESTARLSKEASRCKTLMVGRKFPGMRVFRVPKTR
jgi:hypothetical protein